MSETAAVQAPAPAWIRVKIAYLPQNKKTIRLLYNEHNDEYYSDHLDLSQYQSGDFVDVNIEHGRIVGIQFPPGMEPPAPVKPAEPPKAAPSQAQQAAKVEQPKPAQQTSPAVQKPKACKLIKREGDARALVLTLAGKEQWFNLDENAQKNLIRLKDGTHVILGFSGETLTKMLPATPDGQYDKEGWVKGTGGKGGYRSDPMIDLIRNYSILHEAVLDKAVDWMKFCILNNVNKEDTISGWNQILDLTQKGSLNLYQEIEKKYRYQGGQ
ncbi:MAG TPA: hypothetical protein VN372_05280 [Methanospirillum sp.]|nr:hypothetical protein [Methanospirillum sp.]